MVLATVLALVAAAMHAAWNLLIKTADERDLAAWGQFVSAASRSLPVLLFTGVPTAASVPFVLAVSALVHVVYVRALIAAYHHGDFSLAYPLARGGGALTAALLGIVALGDGLGLGGWLALLVVTMGLASLIRPGAPAGGDRLRPSDRGAHRHLHGHRRRRRASHRQRLRVRHRRHRGERARALGRRGVGRAGSRHSSASVRRSWPRHLVSGVLPRDGLLARPRRGAVRAGRRTSPRCGSRRSCSGPVSDGCSCTSDSVVAGSCRRRS